MIASRWIAALAMSMLFACGSGGASAPTKQADEHGDEDDDHGAEEGDDHDEESADMVRLTPEQVATIKVTSVLAATRAVASTIVATAEVVPPDTGVARVGSKASGRITRLLVGVGDKVKKGQTIAILDTPALGAAKADYLQALVDAKVTRDVADRERALFDKKISSERDYLQAEATATRARASKEAAEARLHTLGFSDRQLARLTPEQHSSSALTVSAPIDGVIVDRPVTLGQMVEPSDTLAEIMDLASVWLQVEVYERDLAQIKVGQAVTATVGAWPGREFVGAIAVIGAVVDRRSRTIKTRVVIDNPDGALKPGMFAQVKLAGSVGEPRQGLFVPAQAVQRDGDGAIVFVPVGDTEFQVRTVELGVTTDDWIEIQQGIVAGERVVVTGTFQLKSEARKGSFGGHDH